MPWCQDGDSTLLESCWLAGQAAFLEHPLEQLGEFAALSSQSSVRGTTARYYLFPDFNPRDDFSFSVLIHRVVKIFRLGTYKLGLAFLWFILNIHSLCPSRGRDGLPAVAPALRGLLFDWAS